MMLIIRFLLLAVSIAIVVGVARLVTFPLRKLAQKVYDETSYNALKGWVKFFTIIFGLADFFLAVLLSVGIDRKDTTVILLPIMVMLLFMVILTLFNKKAGLKNAVLLTLAQTIAGPVMIILLIVHRAVGGMMASRVTDILSIDENA